jgi:DnaJ-class molecular chaperone
MNQIDESLKKITKEQIDELLSPIVETCVWCKGTGVKPMSSPIVTNGFTLPALQNVPCFKCSGTGKCL